MPLEIPGADGVPRVYTTFEPTGSVVTPEGLLRAVASELKRSGERNVLVNLTSLSQAIGEAFLAEAQRRLDAGAFVLRDVEPGKMMVLLPDGTYEVDI